MSSAFIGHHPCCAAERAGSCTLPEPMRDTLTEERAAIPAHHGTSAAPPAYLIAKYGRPGPRYTSYPAVPYWPATYTPSSYEEALAHLGRRRPHDATASISIYVHIPFCEKRCLFCACNVVISRAHERGMQYVDLVRHEADLVVRAMGGACPRVRQVHWGGGTPTWLSVEELEALHRVFAERFEMLPDREQSIEVDPRVTTPEQLTALRALGLNRLSMGVQDVDPTVQDAISRRQTVAQTDAIIRHARSLGIGGITVDIIYGLPFQTPESFQRTVQTVIDFGVDRIAVYNFAYLPERVKHQRAIPSSSLPAAEARVELFRTAADAFSRAGYDLIGMDHFAKKTDELALALRDGSLQRNFMGYTTRAGCDLVSFGVSAISRVGRDFAQNAKTTAGYSRALQAGHLPVVGGMRLGDEDLAREGVIQSVMCYGHLDLERVHREHGLDLLASQRTRDRLAELESDGLITFAGRSLWVTPLGRYFVRNIAMVFDPYLSAPPALTPEPMGEPVQIRFSRTV